MCMRFLYFFNNYGIFICIIVNDLNSGNKVLRLKFLNFWIKVEFRGYLLGIDKLKINDFVGLYEWIVIKYLKDK